MDDAKIIQAFFDRDEEAITASRCAYGSYCAAVARNILSDEGDIEEVLSDTWLRAWNSIPPQKPDNLKLYLARIARNLSFDKFRSQCRTKRGGGEVALALEELSQCIPARTDPAAHMEARELNQAINRFLATLPRRDRDIFLLRYFYAEPAQSIAMRCSIRPGLVRTVLSRTRKKLKTYLEEEGLLND